MNTIKRLLSMGYIISVCIPLIIGAAEKDIIDKTYARKVTAPRQLKILMVVDRWPWYTKQVIINQFTGLIDRGHDVYVFAETRMPDYNIDASLEKYNILERSFFEDLPSDLDTYDIIIFQYGYLGKKYCHIKNDYNIKAKMVTFFRGADITSQKQARADEYQSLFNAGDLFLPICEYFKYRLILLGCDSSKIAVQYSGVDCSRFKFKKRALSSKENIYLLSVGRLIEKKGIEYVIHAINSLIKTYPQMRYIIVGDGSSRKKIEQLITQLKLQSYIKVVGWETQEEVIEMLYRAHIFVSPSITSKGGIQDAPINALKEAMLTGLPVISTYHGGIIELVDNDVSGLLVPERDTVSLAKSIAHLIEHSKQWYAMGKAGREKVLEKFDMEKLNDQLEALLLDLVNT